MFEIDKMPKSIDIGYTGETCFRDIKIDMSAWMEKMPEGIPSIILIRPWETAEDAYIAATTFEDNILTWVITDADLGTQEGEGLMQIWLEEEENDSITKRGKSVKVTTRVVEAADDPAEDPPAAQQAWITQMTALKVATVNAAGAAADSAEDAEAWAVGKRNGADVGSTDPTYENNAKYYAGIAEDAKDDAESAKQYAEDAQAAAEIAAGHGPKIDSGTGNWKVWDAEDGQYEDTGVHAKGDKGDPGDPTELIDDDAGEGDTDKVWSADKTDAELSDVKSAINSMTVEETLLRDELPGTTTTVTMDSNGNPTSIVHSADGTTVRTDAFVWSTGSVVETRTSSDYYITITTNLETLAQTISEVQEVA